MSKVLVMLIGPKGAGKTHLGTLCSRRSGIRFLPVEPIWIGLRPGENGWRRVEEAIDAAFADHDTVMIESLGVGDGFRSFLARLRQAYLVRLIRVRAAPKLCLARIRQRPAADQVPHSWAAIRRYNQLAAQVEHPWDLVCDNDHPGAEADIIAAILALVGSAAQGNRPASPVPGPACESGDGKRHQGPERE